MVEIPVIDFSQFTNGDVTTRKAVVEQIYQACHEIGFMYLENDGILLDLKSQVFTKSKYFFDLPLNIKQQLAWSDASSNQGYVGLERECLNPNQPGDLKEAFNVGRRGGQGGKGGEITEAFLSTPGDDPCIINFYEACTQVANRVLKAMALALQLPADFFVTRHNRRNHTLRLLHYPPLQQPPKIGQVRAGEHSDYGSITLLFQNEGEGLEVQALSGEWVAAPPIPGTVVVNIGDLLQRWTNHVFCSTKHRVVIPTDERINQSRYSIAFFCHPNDDTEIACLESCQNERLPLYPPVLAGDYLISRLQATYHLTT